MTISQTASGKYAHISFKPPQGARDAAKRSLEVRKSKPPSDRGMTPVGISRARDLIAGKDLSPDTVRRMKAFFDRHQSDKKGSTWDSQGKGWQAWMGWGGDPGYAWARKVVNQMNAADAKDTKSSSPSNPEDIIHLTVPLLIRLLEYAREDAKTDMDLHNLTENLISAEGVLDMKSYDSLVPNDGLASDLSSALE